MPIRVYNTLTKQKEPFETVAPGKVGIYLCGPTVYKASHIGHMVGPVIFDAIKRYLTYSGYEVTWVVNITDVDDKLIGQQHERGIPMSADRRGDDDRLPQQPARRWASIRSTTCPRRPSTSTSIIEFTQALIDKGFAYASGGDVFFDVPRTPATAS